MSQDLIFRLAGNVVGGLLFLAIAYAVARALQKRRKSEDLPKFPIVVGIAVALIAVVPAVNRTLGAAQDAKRVDAMIVRQPANGLTDADITPEYAQELKAYLLENIQANMPTDAGKITGGAAGVMVVNGRRILVNRFALNGQESMVSIAGLVGREMVRVTCSTGGPRIDYRSPECASAIRQGLHVELP